VESLAALLDHEGAHTRTATSGAEALRIAETAEFDLVISDIAMPAMDGLQLVSALRSNARTKTWPAFALTGFGRPSDAERTKAAGFDLHLGKPLPLDALIEAYRQLKETRR
jgi:two-component system CheB/CheR fusion protein